MMYGSERESKETEIRYSRSLFGVEGQANTLVCKSVCSNNIAYALSPVDLVPDFIPVLRYLDDLILLPLLVALTLKFIPEETFQKYRYKFYFEK